MRVRFFASPVHAPEHLFDVDEPININQVLDRACAPDWFRDFGVVRVGGEVLPRELWSIIKLRPDAQRYCDLCVVPRRKNILPLLLTVATVALAASISGGLLGPGALGLGATFASGGTGAYLAAAAVSVGGQLLSSALTAPPSIGQQQDAKTRQMSQAGTNINPTAVLENLPVIFGKIAYSPPLVMPSYTELVDQETWINVAVGLDGGPYLIENVKINGIAAANFARAQVEVKQGFASDATPAMASRTVVQKSLNSETLSTFLTVDQDVLADRLKDQTNPDNSMPSWHVVETSGNLDEFKIRLSAPSGIVNTDSGADAFVPIRIEGRIKGSPTWRKFPTIHLQDTLSASGPITAEITIKRSQYPAGLHYTYSGAQWPVMEITAVTAPIVSFAYSSDAYFQSVNYLTPTALPVFSSASSGVFTFSASSEFSAGTSAWKCSDNSTGTYWRPANNSLPATLTLTCSTPQKFRSYQLKVDTTSYPTAPMAWQVHGFDGTSWVLLHDLSRVGLLPQDQLQFVYNLENSALYWQYRWTFTNNNGAVNQELRVVELLLFTHPSPGFVLETEPSGLNAGWAARNGDNNICRATNCEVTPDGCVFYLDPLEWGSGQYEFRLKRGVAADRDIFVPLSYSYASERTNADFFERRLLSGKHVIYVGQKRYRSDISIESVSTIDWSSAPFDHSGLALIAVRAPDLNISSITADFTSYGNTWNGSVWSSTPSPTKNPAALYRDVLRGRANAQVVDDAIIDNADFVAWYNRCAAEDHQANFVAQGQTVESVLQTIASTGFASPRHSNVEGIVEDYDTSALPIELNLTPLNSRDTGTSIIYPRTVHAIVVEYADEEDEYKIKQSYVYLDSYNSSSAEIFETWQLPGFTSEAKATARAEFDIQQSRLRASRYNFEIGVEAYKLRRGSVVGITSDVLNHKNSFGIIKTVTRSGGNIVSIQLDNIIPWSVSAELSETMGVAIQLADGTTTMVKTVTETTDKDTCTFTTPFADTGVVVPGLMVATGVAGKEFRRCKVMSIKPKSGSEWAIELADERPELFA